MKIFLTLIMFSLKAFSLDIEGSWIISSSKSSTFIYLTSSTSYNITFKNGEISRNKIPMNNYFYSTKGNVLSVGIGSKEYYLLDYALYKYKDCYDVFALMDGKKFLKEKSFRMCKIK